MFKNLAGMISILYWFNPIIKEFVKEFYNFCELSCDEAVTEIISKEEFISYAKLIGETKVSFVSSFSASALKSSKKILLFGGWNIWQARRR